MARGGYAQGEYFVKCRKCECGFTGDKRAYECADCAYAGSNRPPSCDLPPEFYRKKLKPCPFCGRSDISQASDYVYCEGCVSTGPSDDPHGHKWNSIPRRSEVIELIRLVDELKHAKTSIQSALAFRSVTSYADQLRKEMGE